MGCEKAKVLTRNYLGCNLLIDDYRLNTMNCTEYRF